MKTRSDFMLAINQLCAERKLSREVVLEAVEAALISAYKRNFGAADNIEVRIDPNSGETRVFAKQEIVESVTDPKVEITLAEAQQINPEAELGETVLIESTPRDFGRIAAQLAKQVILQRIREAERDAQYSAFADSAGDIALGTIQSQDFHSQDVIVSLDGAEALLPAREQVPGERYRRGTRLRSFVLDVRRGNRGPQITLSRRSPALLRRLLELEVPEIFNGTVEIKGIAREAGSRSKVAVHATQEGVDPVGSCVGVRGGRIQNVVNELGGEKIDVVQWDPEMATFIANALSPAKVMNVLLDDDPDSGKTGTVIVPDRQLSLAIGKEGQNARLAAKLTGWRIDIKSATEAAEETMGRFEAPELAPEDMDLLSLAEVILRKGDKPEPSEEESIPTPVEAEAVSEQDAPKLEAEPVPETPPEEEPAVEDTALLEEGPEPEAAGAEIEQIPAEVAPEPALEARLPRDEDEMVPTFEGEPVKDSLGWVVTQPEEDYYDGWSEQEEELEYWEEEEPDLDKLLEEEGAARGIKPKTKTKKKKGRRVYNDDVEDYDDWR